MNTSEGIPRSSGKKIADGCGLTHTAKPPVYPRQFADCLAARSGSAYGRARYKQRAMTHHFKPTICEAFR